MDKSAREILDHLNLGIVIVDEHLNILFRNRFHAKI
jgi:c-di-AMP phosphodiesterase-like protein